MAEEVISGPNGPHAAATVPPAAVRPSDWRILLRTTLSIALGGASGAIVNFFTAADGDFARIDWHKLGITALVGALVTVCGHYMPPPNK
jgi:hypothetical protein